MMGANILVEKLVTNGACTDIDEETCTQAIVSILKNGDVTIAKALIGGKFTTFKKNYRAAYETVMHIPEPEIDTRSWAEITADVVD